MLGFSIKKKFSLLMLLILTLTLLHSYFVSYKATAQLTQQANATLLVQPMFGFHSDWQRTFIVNDGQSTKSIQLFEDTGWWSGSNLYLHTSGTYVVHEGQNGCFGFALNPLTYDIRASISCEKRPELTADASKAVSRLDGYPASPYYEGLFYIGRFVETNRVGASQEDQPRSKPVIFQTFIEHSETELPDIL
ncbi:hypothetical protein [Epibacterium ulvae]|uniref:hypothetical protein n=1 Tax=Epibacterium ulvae TaxID=1156985 RepID=UPI0024915B3C|nr:hypothetical protein [Epibacterium ulvae]